MIKSLVSIIVPIYNVEKYLDRCISSIVNQTYDNLELILVDDGSPDSCPDICDKWAEKDKRIKVIHRINGGLSAARNSGLDIAMGEYIYFVDSDDWIAKETVEDNVNVLDDQEADVVCFNYFLVSGGNEVLVRSFRQSFTDKDLLKDILIRKLPVSVCLKLYRSKLWKDVRFRINMRAEDWYVMPDILLNADKVVVNEKAYYYRNRDNETSIQNNFQIKEFYDEFLCVTNVLKYENTLDGELVRYFYNERFRKALKVYHYNFFTGHFGDRVNNEVKNFICYNRKLTLLNLVKWLDFATLKIFTIVKSVEYFFKVYSEQKQRGGINDLLFY